MLNKQKIKLMTRAAIYEESVGREDLKINMYFASDYIRVNLLKTLIGVTVGYLLAVMLFLGYRYEELLAELANMDLMAMVMDFGVYYVILLAVYAVCALIYYSYKKHQSERNVRQYYAVLKKIEAISEQELSDGGITRG